MDALTKNQLSTLKKLLSERLAELHTLLSDSLESSKPVGLDQPIGRLSRMDALQQQSMTQASRRAAQTRIALIESALSRIGRDDYGYCMECEEEIGFARLQVQPEAAFCLECQTRRERK